MGGPTAPNFFGRFPRRSRFVGGTLDGRDSPLPLPSSMAEPAYQCYRSGLNPWEHYVRRDDGLYHFVGECAAGNHDGLSLPHEHKPCCGNDPGCHPAETAY